jgi:hypothetical protein
VLLGGPAYAKPGMVECARLLLDAGADPSSHEPHTYGRVSALYCAISGGQVELVRLLRGRGAETDQNAYYLAADGADGCEQESEAMEIFYLL